jgi:group I intron endonuclease
MVGIYKITSPTGKVYVGQSTNIENRKKQYERLSCKSQTKLYNSIMSHGWENHQHDIIEECNVDQLNEREIFWGDYYDVLGKNGLVCRLGEGNGYYSEETKQKMRKPKPEGYGDAISKNKERKQAISLSLKNKPKPEGFGNKLSKPKPANNKPINQYDKQGNFIKEWVSIKEAETFYRPKPVLQDNIGACCRGLQNSAYGFVWKFK